jgi:hypothetical protein
MAAAGTGRAVTERSGLHGLADYSCEAFMSTASGRLRAEGPLAPPYFTSA